MVVPYCGEPFLDVVFRQTDTFAVSLRDAKMEYLLATRGAKASKKLKDFWF